MKKFTCLLVIAMLFTLGNAPMSKTASEVVLDASQVTSARDIEMALDTRQTTLTDSEFDPVGKETYHVKKKLNDRRFGQTPAQ